MQIIYMVIHSLTKKIPIGEFKDLINVNINLLINDYNKNGDYYPFTIFIAA